MHGNQEFDRVFSHAVRILGSRNQLVGQFFTKCGKADAVLDVSYVVCDVIDETPASLSNVISCIRFMGAL